LEEIGIPELTLEQVAELCESAEQSARDYVLSKVSTNRIMVLDVTVDAEGTKPVTANVDVTVVRCGSADKRSYKTSLRQH
jgi:hypothetical protein